MVLKYIKYAELHLANTQVFILINAHEEYTCDKTVGNCPDFKYGGPLIYHLHALCGSGVGT